MFPLLCAWVLVVVKVFADVPGAGSGSGTGRDPLNDFCRIWGHSAAYIENKLFLDGGYLNWTPLSQNHMNSTSKSLTNHLTPL
jgi:hypothetical protein